METVFFQTGHIREATELVKTYHYSHRSPPVGIVMLVGTWHLPGGFLGDCGLAVAACIFARPMARWRDPRGMWELIRLVRAEEYDLPPLTKLISLTCQWAKKQGAHLLISYADRTFNHHGGIYQAASWNYSGMRQPSSDGLVVNGRFIPARTAVAKLGSRSPDRTRFVVERHFDLGKHVYWRALDKIGRAKAAELGFTIEAYPKIIPSLS